MVKLGYGFSYRVLDAQYFGVAQRRRRVFVVGYLGDWRSAAAVLFERESLSGHPSPREQAGQEVAKCLTSRVGSANDALTETFVTEQEKVNAITASYGTGGPDWETKPLVFGAQNSSTQSLSASTEVSPTLDKSKTPAVAHTLQTQCGEVTEDGTGRGAPLWPERATVRRLTPVECERLQGFPDGYTNITYRNKPAADGPRYKALGNSMAVPVMRWIGERINMVEQLNG
jgi:DNA (cytosine-5)-methyltransferase 1